MTMVVSMHLIVSKLTKYCINTKLIQAKYAPWLQYSLEKRITLIFTLIPFFLLAVYMTSLSCALSFYISFYLIRSHASGFHMKTAESCIIVSLAMEFLFFKRIAPPFLAEFFLKVTFLSLRAPLVHIAPPDVVALFEMNFELVIFKLPKSE